MPRLFAEHLRHHDARLDALHQERSEIAVQGPTGQMKVRVGFRKSPRKSARESAPSHSSITLA